VKRSEEMILLQRPDATAAIGIKLEQGTHVVGRSVDCDVVLHDASVSRRHAELVIEGSTVTVRDLQSRNGTFVGEVPIQSRQVAFGERIRFGSVNLVVRRFAASDVEKEIETLDADHGGEPSLGSTISYDLPLSAAQRRVFDLLLAGLSEKQAAARLKVSRHTVHTHVRQIYRVLGVRSRAELLARFVQQRGDTESPES
jgi:pSer/pThr/pTyr-binding forkhead associated (FHA) protein